MLLLILLEAMVITVISYPGPPHVHPALHFAPSYVSDVGGWHDIAGALTHKGVHHVYQGQGWNHAFSKDLVHWTTGAHGPSKLHEKYHHMDSFSDPCSGFLTKDVDGSVCAGFRQCGSSKGVDGGHPWDVPLELRCALDDDLTAWSEEPDYLFNVTWYRGIPYDPARPWREADGYWYVLLSMDACNATTQKLPCEAGGQLHMWRSAALRSEFHTWEHVGPVFTSKATVLKAGHLTKEFVTIDYIGNLQGDPSPTRNTRLFFNNVGGNGGGEGCCSGTTSYFVVTQQPGAQMMQVGPQSMVDWGAFAVLKNLPNGSTGLDRLDGTASRGLSMARTLGSEESDQVTKDGRRVMIGWAGPGPNGQGSAQSLPRDLSLGADRALRQSFVPELKVLRRSHVHTITSEPLDAGLQAEVLVSFTTAVTDMSQLEDFGFSVLGEHGKDAKTKITLSPRTGLVTVDATSQNNPQVRGGPLPAPFVGSCQTWTVHAMIDHSIIELIVNNVTALVVFVTPSSPSAGQIELLGAQSVNASMDMWTLASANHSSLNSKDFTVVV
eukprot:gnl/MRDRNA2_/MRDRNA2_123742_c0_seq1.p1 gnl/MRDRNA2_/MRDRNA2_123742_c0~~gnl/MRDRNA2_/MRDRNA2_123742_c0_seq1.p1  ORF type:complete len:551 (+),score=93.20 gnl/MRDRNA2_/MRDRNA2_123742_c0_seq1:62-1714(+)